MRREVQTKLSNFPTAEAGQIANILVAPDVAARSLHDLRPAMVLFQHSIELTDGKPIYHQYRRTPPKHNEIVKKELGMMLVAGVVTPASSEWPFPVVIASEKNGTPRFCVGYRALNQQMKAGRFPLPKIQEIIDELAEGHFFTTLDFFSGCWQIRISESWKEKTTLVCCFGTYLLEVILFGLMNAPSTLQRVMGRLLGIFRFVKV